MALASVEALRLPLVEPTTLIVLHAEEDAVPLNDAHRPMIRTLPDGGTTHVVETVTDESLYVAEEVLAVPGVEDST